MPPRPVTAAATPGPKAYSYIRFSTPEQALGDSKRRQVEEARAWAAAHGLRLDEELADEGVSGFRGANTRDDSALGAFLKAVHMGDVPQGSVLIVESLDRLSRDRILAAQNVLTSLLLAGVRIVTLTDRREYSEETVNENPTDLLVSLLTVRTRGVDQAVFLIAARVLVAEVVHPASAQKDFEAIDERAFA